MHQAANKEQAKGILLSILIWLWLCIPFSLFFRYHASPFSVKPLASNATVQAAQSAS